MPLRDIIGQSVAVRSLLGTLKSGRLGHAFLFIGPAGVGKRTSALAFAQAVNCAAPMDDADACGVCPSCRRVERGVDIDARVYSPTRQGYRKEEAKEIRNDAHMTPNAGKRRFLILDDADAMGAEAANALLKVIEEPPEMSVFVLLTEKADRIMPTIKSRVLSVPFRPLTPAEAAAVAGERLSGGQVDYLFPIARGNMGEILRLSEDRKLKELFEDVEAELFERLLKEASASPTRLAEEVAALAVRIDLSTAEDTESTARRKSVAAILEIMMSMVERKHMTVGAGAGEMKRGCDILETLMSTIQTVRGGGLTESALEAMAINLKAKAGAA